MAFKKEHAKWCKEMGALCLCSVCHHMQAGQSHPFFLASRQGVELTAECPDHNPLVSLHFSDCICLCPTPHLHHLLFSRPLTVAATAAIISLMLAKLDSASPQLHHRHLASCPNTPLPTPVREMSVETSSHMQPESAGG